MLARILVMLSMLFSCNSYAGTNVPLKGWPPAQENGNDDAVARNPRLLFLDGLILAQTIAPLQAALRSIIRSPSRAAVTIVINSPGGGVIAGSSFINSMQTIREMDIEINCYVLDMAASMAFQILTQCSNRYALPTSYLLWHGVRMGTQAPITVVLARQIADDLERMDGIVLYQLTETLNLSPNVVLKHFNNETLWSGLGLHSADPKFLTLMPGYPRLLPLLDTAVHMSEMPMFFFGGMPPLEGYQYVWSNWQLRVPSTDQ